MFKGFLFGLVLTVPIDVFAEFQDPTKPNAIYNPPIITDSKKDTVPKHDLVLTGIWLSTQTKRATINNITVKEGEMILENTVKVVRIEKNAVTVEDNGVIKTLFLVKSPHKI